MIEATPLRKKLLDLAISGKLVPKTGEWKTVKLGEIAEVQLGKMLDRGKNIGTPYKYLANVNVRWGTFDLSNLKETLFTQGDVEKFKLIPGDLLMCEGGVPGRCAIWREENSSIKYQKAVHRIRPSASVTAEYLQIYFESIHDKLSFVRKFTGSTIHHLPREVLILEPIPLPPLAEQKAIVKRLEELLALEREIAADSAALDDLIIAAKRKILDLAVSGKLVPKMGSWETAGLGDVAELISGRDLLPSEYFNEPKKVPYITGASNFASGNIVINRWTDVPCVVSCVGDVLITCKGTIGEIAINKIGEMHIARQIMALRPYNIEGDFLKIFMEASQQKLQQSAHGVIPGIARKDMLDLKLPLPPLAEQKAIVKRVEELFAVLDAMKEV